MQSRRLKERDGVPVSEHTQGTSQANAVPKHGASDRRRASRIPALRTQSPNASKKTGRKPVASSPVVAGQSQMDTEVQARPENSEKEPSSATVTKSHPIVGAQSRRKRQRKADATLDQAPGGKIDVGGDDPAHSGGTTPQEAPLWASASDSKVYKPPQEARLPEETVLIEGSSTDVHVSVPSAAIGDLYSAYVILRSFSWQVRLSPFSFEDFCKAMLVQGATQLMDEIHVCVLRALAMDEVQSERNERTLDLGLLDQVTWPSYVWEMLRLLQDPLSKYEWTHRCHDLRKDLREEERVAAGDGTSQFREIGSFRNGVRIPEKKLAAEESSKRRRWAFEPVDVTHMDSQLRAEVPRPIDNTIHGSADVSAQGHFALVAPAPLPQQQEYYVLPIDMKAAILARLCDSLLECTTFRAEIDRREAAGAFVSGTGGEGGAFPLMTPEEKKRAEDHAVLNSQSDANTDACVLCGVGGNLICCDGCPAAYHMRCLGESGKSLGDGDWLCPECAVGGRGETAGLRVPVAAYDKWNQPLHLVCGSVVRSEIPAVFSRGCHAVELPEHLAVTVYVDKIASVELRKAIRVNTVDEAPRPSSYDAVEARRPWPAPAEGATGPEAYSNRYRNGWGSAAVAVKSTVEDAKKRKLKGGLRVPTGTCGQIPVPELPVPLPLSRFQWVQIPGRPVGRASIRCGKCHTCLRPTLRKGCLNPVMLRETTEDEATGTVQGETSKLGYLIAYVLKVEREFWGLAGGPWADGKAGGMQFRAQWAMQLRSAMNVAQVAKAVLQLEGELRPIAFVRDWHGEDGEIALHIGTRDGASSGTSSRAVSRTASAADLRTSLSQATGQPIDASLEMGNAQGNSFDPYDIRFERCVKAGWEVNRRHHAAHVSGVNRLPLFLVRKAARQSGRRYIPGIKYKKQKWALQSPRLAWAAEAEASQTCAQLAIVLRKLDDVLNWETVARPKTLPPEYSNSSIRNKRLADNGKSWEYLVEYRPLGWDANPSLNQQQQMMAALIQQRIALAQAQSLAAQQQLQPPGLAPLSDSLPILPNVQALPWAGNAVGMGSHLGLPPFVSLPHHHGIPRPDQSPAGPIPSGIPPSLPALAAGFMPPTIVRAGPAQVVHTSQPHPAIKTDAAQLLPRSSDDDEDHAIVKSIIEGAIKKALEAEKAEEMLQMPAAMAAKLRKRQMAGSNGDLKQLKDEVAEKKEKPSDKKAAALNAQIAPPQWGPFFQQAHRTPLPRAPSWVSEWDLPLWLIRGYEELCRREAANAAARELQAAARSQVLNTSDIETKEAARRAAHAAAAAAADACGVCSVSQAENPESDLSWICCDTCNRWFHGACVGMTQEDVDGIPEDEQWDCPGCRIARRKAERAARREGKLIEKAPLVGETADPGGKKVGRPAKPFYERADYKASEAKMLEKLKQGITPQEQAGKRKRGRPPQNEILSLEEPEARLAERAERLRRKKEEAGEPNEPPPIHCPVCQYPDHGRLLASCHGCARSFHYECFGAAVEEVEDTLVQGGELRCAECQGKRARPPSQAAIAAAILAAAERAQYNKGARPLQKNARVQPHTNMRIINSWQQTAVKIVNNIMRLPSAADFRDPVQPEDASDYGDVVKAPMDLRTLADRVSEMESPLDVVAALRLIVDNCILYNGESSEFTAAAREMQTLFHRLWIQAALPLTKEEWEDALRQQGMTASLVPDWHLGAVVVIEKIAALDAGMHFREPVPRGFMNYYRFIRRPMDLGTIAKKLRRRGYATPAEVEADVALVWSNCRKFNEPRSAVVKDAATCETAFKKAWEASGIPQVSDSQAPKETAASGRHRRNLDWKEAAAKVLYRVINRVAQAAWFADPVDVSELPEYLQIIPHPMDLGTVSQKLKDDVYAMPADLLADVELIWSNAATFNGPEHPVTQAAVKVSAAFDKLWESAGLPPREPLHMEAKETAQ